MEEHLEARTPNGPNISPLFFFYKTEDPRVLGHLRRVNRYLSLGGPFPVLGGPSSVEVACLRKILPNLRYVPSYWPTGSEGLAK